MLTDGVVTLRAHTEADVQTLLEQSGDPLSVRWTTVPVPPSEENSRGYATEIIPKGWEQGTAWAFAVEARDESGNPRFCGTVELRDEGDRRAEIAYGAHSWARGRGILERACRLLLEWGFREKRLLTVIWWSHEGNWASRKLAWRLGFSMDGGVKQWLPQRGDLRDAWVGSLRAGEKLEPRTDWLDLPVIQGPAVTLREFRHEDAVRVEQACSDPRTRHWLSDLPTPYTRDSAHAYIESRKEQLATGTGLSWAVADPQSDDVLAAISVFDLKPGRQAEIGYWTHPEARGRGVMTEACRLVVRHCFVPVEDGGLGLQRVAIAAGLDNEASRHVMKSVGFTEVGRERQATRTSDGTVMDTVLYDLLVGEWSGVADDR